MYKFVPTETLSEDDDDGTMPENVETLANEVVGHRIVSVDRVLVKRYHWDVEALQITLDTGKTVLLEDSSDCCAYTELESFIFNADKIDHIITGVSTEDEYTKWHIFADAGDVLQMNIGWSSGNPFYYGYGFTISVTEPS